jgi:hypothetical protein
MKVFFGFFIASILLLSAFMVFYPKFFNPKNNIIPKIGTKVGSSVTVTPFSLKDAPSESLKAKLEILTNDVLFEDRTATESSKITASAEVEQGERVETDKTGKAKISFPNVLDLDIFENSSISVLQTLPVNLVFSLNKGALKAEKKGQNTVSVRAKHLLINVNGSVTIVIDDKKPTITIEVTDGSAILAYNNLNYDTQSLTLLKGRKVIFNDSSRKAVAI